jgi:hypothetical protein
MPKLIKAFLGVPEGEIYPRQFLQGDDCPPELIDGAKSVGALDEDTDDEQDDAPGSLTVAQMRTALDAKGIQYKAGMKKADLAALLSNADSGAGDQAAE